MDNIFIVAGVIAFVFLIAKFFEMRFVDKENKPVKLLFRDALLVYFSVICGYYILEQFKTNIQSGGGLAAVAGPSATPVFTDNPGF
jgi:hypothetical protein